MLAQGLLWRLPSAAMTTEEELHSQRLGYWLRRVRLRRDETLESAAIASGLAPTSGSTVSMWERGLRPIKVQQLRRLARFYAVPEEFFIDPPMTDEERLSNALADAEELEREDWESGPEASPAAAGGHDGAPRRLH